jgi:hypothetical protein
VCRVAGKVAEHFNAPWRTGGAVGPVRIGRNAGGGLNPRGGHRRERSVARKCGRRPLAEWREQGGSLSPTHTFVSLRWKRGGRSLPRAAASGSFAKTAFGSREWARKAPARKGNRGKSPQPSVSMRTHMRQQTNTAKGTTRMNYVEEVKDFIRTSSAIRSVLTFDTDENSSAPTWRHTGHSAAEVAEEACRGAPSLPRPRGSRAAQRHAANPAHLTLIYLDQR